MLREKETRRRNHGVCVKASWKEHGGGGSRECTAIHWNNNSRRFPTTIGSRTESLRTCFTAKTGSAMRARMSPTSALRARRRGGRITPTAEPTIGIKSVTATISPTTIHRERILRENERENERERECASERYEGGGGSGHIIVNTKSQHHIERTQNKERAHPLPLPI